MKRERLWEFDYDGGLSHVFKMEGYKGPDAYDDKDKGLSGAFREHLERVFEERRSRKDTPGDQDLQSKDLKALDMKMLDKVEALISELDRRSQKQLMDALLRGNYGRMKFRSDAYFRRWVEIFAYFGLGEPKVDRFLGGARRDVAVLMPNTEVTVFARWKDFMGKHVMHCHNVVHEDHAMMIRWDIVPQGHGFDTPKHTDDIPQSLGDPVESERKEHIESHPAGGAHQPDDS